jgi:hypothetical protein
MSKFTDELRRFWSAAMTGYKAFNESYFQSDQINLADFTDYDARRLRYSILWAMYENTAYDKIHRWSVSYKTQKGLYKYIRNIYNPSYRLGEFWKTKLLGGMLDPEAGDGEQKPSALPIVTKNEALRPAIAQVWNWSNWQIKKDVFGLWTPILGDGVLSVVDDPSKKKVYMKVMHPGNLKAVELDDFGNVKGYILEYKREDPRLGRSGMVTYKETATRNGDDVEYKTYLDNGLYKWDGETAEWSVPYGFVPMVVLQHNDVGLDFGWSELYPGLSKFREVDDQASKLHDQIRKLVEGAWLIAGLSKPTATPVATGQDATDEKPQPGREEMKIIYATNPGATATSLVSPIQIGEVSANIKDLISELERDFPELKVDLANASQDLSGRALRINRAPAEAKVMQRRPNYDNAIVRAHQMAVAIGGYRGYGDAFNGFDLDSYAAGALDHSIGKRSVFDTDPQDKLDENGTFWDNAKKARDAGVPLPVFLKQQGWTPERINEVINSEEYKLKLESARNLANINNLASGEGSGRMPFNQNQNQNQNNQNQNNQGK